MPAYRTAIEYAHEIGLQVYLSRRMGSMPVKPLWRVRNRDGTELPRLSYAYPESQDQAIDVLKQMVSYRPDGIALFFHKGMPFVRYEDSVVQGFVKETGADPLDLPEDDPEWLRWRAGFVTGFPHGAKRELTEYAAEQGLAPPRIAIYVLATGHRLSGNLYCHLKGWTEEASDRYRELGYEFIAAMDHDQIVMLEPREDMIFLPGAEMSPGHHLVFGVNDVDNLKTEGGDRYSATLRMIRETAECGGLSFLAHPLWSGWTFAELRGLCETGLDGIEVLNATCWGSGDTVCSDQLWHGLLSPACRHLRGRRSRPRRPCGRYAQGGQTAVQAGLDRRASKIILSLYLKTNKGERPISARSDWIILYRNKSTSTLKRNKNVKRAKTEIRSITFPARLATKIFCRRTAAYRQRDTISFR